MYSIELRTKNTIVIVDQIHPVVTFGRQPHNDFILDSKKVSRTHARLEYRWGKFVLIDQSSNGHVWNHHGGVRCGVWSALMALLGGVFHRCRWDGNGE